MESDGPRVNPFKTRGSLDDWRRYVAPLCVNNSRLIFSASVAFAAPLLFPLGMESGGFSIIGKSSGGKTTALRVGASVCGAPDYLERLRATDNGLESVFLAKSDAAAFLDELGQLGPQIAGEAVYMAANGAQKARASRTGGARERATWRTLFLLSSEVGLAAHMGEAGRAPKAGQQARLADIPADAGRGLGVFEDLHEYASGHEFAQALARAVGNYYGTPFAAFLSRLMRERGEELWDSLLDQIRDFERMNLSDAEAGGQARRVATRFGLVAAAGELAIQWLDLPWQKGAASQAAGNLFQAWIEQRGGAGDQEERAALAQVRDFLSRHGEARFTDWDRPAADTDKHAPRVINRAGFRRITEESEQRAIAHGRTVEVSAGSGNFPEADEPISRLNFSFSPKCGKTKSVRATTQPPSRYCSPSKARLLPGDHGRMARSLSLPGEGKRRVYHITPLIWSGER
jgi:putative DNA primase/helicase